MALESYMYRDPLEAAAIKQSRESGCLSCVSRGRGKDGKTRCGANRPIYPNGNKSLCGIFYRRRGQCK